MKITQEVRDFAAAQAASSGCPGKSRDLELGERSGAGREEFAARQNQSAAPFLPTTPTVRLEPVEGPALSSNAEAEAGMAKMRERFREKSGEIYLPAAG